jgi:hypothetical protein
MKGFVHAAHPVINTGLPFTKIVKASLGGRPEVAVVSLHVNFI